jgi:hypothetical protein
VVAAGGLVHVDAARDDGHIATHQLYSTHSSGI